MKSDKEKRKLGIAGLSYSSGVVSCYDTSVWGDDYDYNDCWTCATSGAGSGSGYTYKYSWSNSCLEYEKTLSGYNFNYNPSTGKAKDQSLYIFNGVSCTNCYAYI